jgi:hypothetical protein
MIRTHILPILLLAGCSGEGGGSDPTSNNVAVSLTFSRVINVGLDDIKVSVSISDNGVPVSGVTPAVTLEAGASSSIVESSSGVYDFTVTPGSSTGEFPVTVSYGGVSKSATALVLNDVHTDWGQPMSVAGLVNTEGYEDGPVISADGEWLFIQTGPIYFSGLDYYADASVGCNGSLVGCEATDHGDWVYDVVGPYTAPERPGFYTERIKAGKINHYTEFFSGMDIFSPPTLFYGFKRQADGSYAEPFRVSVDDNREALLNPFGLYPRIDSPTTASILFAFNNPIDQLGDDGTDIYTAPITLGQDNDLMKFSPQGGMTQTSTTATVLNFLAHDGTQGNPHLYSNNDGTVNSVWVDNEYNDNDALDLFYYELTAGTFPSGTWSTITQLPDNLDLSSSKESMPFFDGTTLYLRRDSSIVSATYSGGAYSESSSWTNIQNIINADACFTGGCIFTVGEPTIATVDGKTYLFFVYALLRSYDGGAHGDLNMQIGVIEKH